MGISKKYDLRQQIENGVSFEQALTEAIEKAKNNDVIKIPNGTFELNNKHVIQKSISLEGEGAGLTNINIGKSAYISFEADEEDAKAYKQDAYLKYGVHVKGITFQSQQEADKKFVANNALKFKYVGRATIDDVIFSHIEGVALELEASQDFYISNIYVRYCGKYDESTNVNLPAVYFKQTSGEGFPESVNVNDIKFIGCTFEHNCGQLIKSNGKNNNSINFTACKFEFANDFSSGKQKDINVSACKFVNASRVNFNNCRFTHYSNATNIGRGFVEFEKSQYITINGECFNRENITNAQGLDPYRFANFNSCKIATVDIKGNKCGNVTQENDSSKIFVNIIEK